MIKENLKVLKSIGPRPLGSENLKEATNFLNEKMKDLSIESELLKSRSIYWDFKEMLFQLDGKKLPGIPNIFTPSCDIECEWIGIQDLKSLRELNSTKMLPESSKSIIPLCMSLRVSTEWGFISPPSQIKRSKKWLN